jgi:hypothetical protein
MLRLAQYDRFTQTLIGRRLLITQFFKVHNTAVMIFREVSLQSCQIDRKNFAIHVLTCGFHSLIRNV